MRRMRSVLAVAVVTAAMSVAVAAPATADVVRFDDDLEDYYEDRAEFVEEYYEAIGLDVDEDVVLHHRGPYGWW